MHGTICAAREALGRAEAAHEEDPGSRKEAHLGYLAARRAHIAAVNGCPLQAEKAESRAQADYLLANLAFEFAKDAANEEIARQQSLEAVTRFADIVATYPDSEYAPNRHRTSTRSFPNLSIRPPASEPGIWELGFGVWGLGFSARAAISCRRRPGDSSSW